MNSISLLNLSFWEKVATIFDILPKTIYFLYACLASAIDAMQSLLRKLAGLDTYFRADTGAEVTGTDPLTEFVYGILGFGESSSIYSALNTVFWSLAIFGLIVLVLTTMMAIIKSHYNEDTAQTSPWKYIYTAIKSILTFAILPVIVIIGLQLSNFVLRTLDNITAGAGAEDEITSMYGDASAARLRSATTADGKTTYAYYDMFGATDPSTNTTFSGMMFNACMYNANRAREDGGYTLSQAQTLMGGFFGQGPEIDAISGSDAKLEYAAGQIDYAFANCLQLNTGYSYNTLKSEAGDTAPVASWSDWYGAGKNTISGFSKYDVATVWIFYDLWQFNMIVGYAGVFVTFAIMISIVIGLMSRLIKGAALFLVYPSILGIAPLDDFKAFKSWGQMFMQQVMMAFGSIIGMNLLLLILPYVQQIEFFEIDIINYIVNVVMMIAGLIMAKDFISIVSGFVGGADANSLGGEMKGQVAGAIKSGVTAPARIVGGAARITAKGAMVVGKGAKAGVKASTRAIGAKTSAWRANRRQQKIDRQNDKATQTIDKQHALVSDAMKNDRSIRGAALIAKQKAQKKGYNEEAQERFAYEAAKQAMFDRFHISEKVKFSGGARALNKDDLDILEIDENKLLKKTDKKVSRLAEKNAKIENRYHLDKQVDKDGNIKYQKQYGNIKRAVRESSQYVDEKGNITEGFKGFAKNMGKESVEWGKTFGDSVMKTLNSGFEGLGIDKTIKAITGQLGESLTFKGGPFKPRREGDALQRQIAGEQRKQSEAQTKVLQDIKKELEKQSSKKDSGDKPSGGGSSGGSSSSAS